MGYKVNPASLEELRRMVVQRLGAPIASDSTSLTEQQASRLLEELAISKIEVESQNVYLQDTCARLDLALNETIDLYDFAPVGFVSIDASGHICKLNLAAAQLLGSERNTLMGTVLVNCFLPDQRDHIQALLQRATESGENQYCDVSLGGDSRPLELVQLSLSPLYSVQGHHLVFTNITARRALEDGLRARERGWKALLDIASDGLWEWDAQGQTLQLSPTLAQLYGIPAEQAGSTLDDWSARVHPEDWPALRDKIQNCLRGTEARFSSEHRALGGDGSWLWVASSVAVLGRDEDGQATRLLGTDANISSTKRAQEDLLEVGSIQRAVFELLPQYLAVLDADGRVLRTNAVWNAYGLAGGHPYRNGLARFAYADLLDEVTGAQDQVKRAALAGIADVLAGKVPSFRLDYSFAQGVGMRWYIMYVMAVQGAYARAVVSHQDVTHIKDQSAAPTQP